MSLLDRYIARQYLFNIAALLVILAFFVVTIDASLHLNRYWRIATAFVEQGALSGLAGDSQPGEAPPLLPRAILTVWLVLDLWWPRLVHLFNFLIGLVLVAAMGFTCTQLVRHRETVAVLTSGQSLFRIARPILLVALGLTLVQALNQEYVIPRIAPLLTRDPGDAGRHELGASRVPPTVDGVGRLFFAGSFDADRGVLTNVYIWDRDETGLASQQLFARQAVWRDGGWDLTEPRLEVRMRRGEEDAGDSGDERGEPLRLPPAARDPGTALDRFDGIGGDGFAGYGPGAVVPQTRIEARPPQRIMTDLDPTMLTMRRYARYGHHLSMAQMAKMLRRLDQLGANTDEAQRTRELLQRVAFGRISGMITNLLTLTIAMAFFITREPRNMLIQSLKCAPVVIVALVGGILAGAAPIPGIPAPVAVFIPVMVLLPVTIAVISRMRT